MSLLNIFIYGSGGLGKEIVELIQCINRENNEWRIQGFIDDDIKMQGRLVAGYKVYSSNILQGEFNPSNTKIIIAIGEPRIKKILLAKIEKLGYNLATLIHPNAYISKSAIIGEGSIVKAGCTVSAGSIIKKNVLVNLGCNIGHDVLLDDNVSISLGCNISGTVIIEKSVFVGSGVNIRDELTIGENSIIGIGSVVVNNINKNMLAYGNPAKEVKSSLGIKIF